MASYTFGAILARHARLGLRHGQRWNGLLELSPSSASTSTLRQYHVARHFIRNSHEVRAHPGREVGIRYASTAAIVKSSTSSSQESSVPVDTSVQHAPSDWALPFDQLEATKTEVEPHIGYLKELGLDYGWGPTGLVQWTFEHLQTYFGLPMLGAAVGVTVIVRFLVLPLALDASDMGARMKAMNPRIKPLREKMTEAMQTGDQGTAAAVRAELSSVMKAANIKTGTMFWPLLVQAPLGFGLFRLTRGMADLPVPGIDTAGLAWFSNLALPDPYYILPAATAGLMWFTMKRGLKDNAPSPLAETTVKVLPFITLAAMSWLPSITQLGFLAAGVWQLGQAEALRKPAIRERLGLHQFVSESDAKPTKAYEGRLNIQSSQSQKDISETDEGMIERAVKAPGNAVKSIKTSAQNFMKKATAADKKKQGRLSASELKHAESYEASRKKEEAALSQERKERERQQRLRRLR